MQSDKRAALNGRRGGIAETQGMKRPCDLQNAKRSLRTAAASRAHSSLPSYGPESTARQGWTKLAVRARRSERYGPGSY